MGRRGVITPLHYLTRKETTMTKLEKVQAEKEQALILLTQVVETYTLRDKGKIQGAYVYSRELLDERINKFFERLGFKNVE